jgi:hypothetical protein
MKHVQGRKLFDLQDKARAMAATIKQMESEQTVYLQKNRESLCQYFEDTQNAVSVGNCVINCNKLQLFFKMEEDAADPKGEGSSTSSMYSQQHQQQQHQHDYLHSTTLHKLMCDKYMRNVGGVMVNRDKFYYKAKTCSFCGKGELVSQDDEGAYICNYDQCSRIQTHFVSYLKPVMHMDQPQAAAQQQTELTHLPYLPLNHYKEILSQFQAKQTTQIPPHVLAIIRERIKKERIDDVSTITLKQMREIMQKTKLNKYMEHVACVNALIGGMTPPIMTEQLCETLCVLFVEIQTPWAVHCPISRSNLVNYHYILYQSCALLGQTQYLPFIALMKDRDKQVEYDMTWKMVCQDLDWEYIAST